MARAKPAESQTAPYILVAIDPVRHDGADYAPGDTLPVSGEQAAALIASGAAQAQAKA